MRRFAEPLPCHAQSIPSPSVRKKIKSLQSSAPPDRASTQSRVSCSAHHRLARSVTAACRKTPPLLKVRHNATMLPSLVRSANVVSDARSTRCGDVPVRSATAFGPCGSSSFDSARADRYRFLGRCSPCGCCTVPKPVRATAAARCRSCSRSILSATGSTAFSASASAPVRTGSPPLAAAAAAGPAAPALLTSRGSDAPPPPLAKFDRRRNRANARKVGQECRAAVRQETRRVDRTR